VLLWLLPTDVSYQVAGYAAGVAGLVYLIRLALVLTRKVDKLNALTVETHDVAAATHEVTAKELTSNGGSSAKDQIGRIETRLQRQERVNAEQASVNRRQSEAIADLTRQVQTAVVLAQQAVEGQERIEEQVGAIDSQVTGINTRLDAGEKRFQKIDRATKALEDVARTQHPESYREPGDFED